jgi:hypothetical protein
MGEGAGVNVVGKGYPELFVFSKCAQFLSLSRRDRVIGSGAIAVFSMALLFDDYPCMAESPAGPHAHVPCLAVAPPLHLEEAQPSAKRHLAVSEAAS